MSQRIAAAMHVEGTWNLHATCFGSVATQRMFGLLASSRFLLKFNPRGTSWMSYGIYKSGRRPGLVF